MSCTLAAISACFSLSGLYTDGALIARDDVVDHYTESSTYEWQTNLGYQLIDSQRSTNFARNPNGRLALGYEIKFDGAIPLAVAFEAAHESSIADAHDRGVNSLSLHVRWYPFARAN